MSDAAKRLAEKFAKRDSTVQDPKAAKDAMAQIMNERLQLGSSCEEGGLMSSSAAAPSRVSVASRAGRSMLYEPSASRRSGCRTRRRPLPRLAYAFTSCSS